MPAKVTAKGKAKVPAAKKPRTCAKTVTEPEDAELEGAIVLASAGMGPVQFHKAATKMRSLLNYRCSDKCHKAHISLYMQAFREAIHIYMYTYYAD